MSERRQAAWDEAQRRYPASDRQAGFVAGAAWADANPKPHTITRGQARVARNMLAYSISDSEAGKVFAALGIKVVDDG